MNGTLISPLHMYISQFTPYGFSLLQEAGYDVRDSLARKNPYSEILLTPRRPDGASSLPSPSSN